MSKDKMRKGKGEASGDGQRSHAPELEERLDTRLQRKRVEERETSNFYNVIYFRIELCGISHENSTKKCYHLN